MLLKLVDQTCTSIEAFDVGEALPLMSQQIRGSAADIVERFIEETRANGTEADEFGAGMILAVCALACVKAIPQQARQMVQRLSDSRLPVAKRCAMASVLAYLVQPHDMIPDSAPGGYGYLDDAIFLRAGLVQYLDVFPDAGSTAEQESSLVGLLIGMTPPAVRAQLPVALAAMGSIVQLFSLVGQGIAEASLAQLMASPLQINPPAAPVGFTPSMPRDFERGFWGRGGAYIEGNNIIMSGGPALINGELFIP